MTRRKQGRPQQRKNIESLEPDQDLLICGECQTEFPLSDIVKFIQHKKNRCNKENSDPLEEDGHEDEEEEDKSVSIISNRRTSISAPIARKSTPELRDKSPRPSLISPHIDDELAPPSLDRPEEMDTESTDKMEETSIGCKEEETKINNNQPKSINSSDTDARCTDERGKSPCSGGLGEPTKFVCQVCVSTFSSAWFLLRHVQNEHGMKIYIDNPESESGDSEQSSQKEIPVRVPSQPSEQSTPKPEPRVESRLESLESDHEQQDGEADQPSSPSEMPPLQPVQHPHPPVHPHPHPHPHPQQHPHQLQPPSSQPNSPRRPPPSLTPPPMIHHGHHQMPPCPPQFLFRMPFPERQPMSPAAANHISPFNRPPGADFRLDLINDPFHRMQALGLASPGFEHPMPGFQNPFERHLRLPPGLHSAAAEASHASALDFYSQRLRQLAGTSTSPSHSPSPARKIHTPPFSSPGGPAPFCSSPNQIPMSESQKALAAAQPPKLKACEFCGKCFRFQSNLIVHRRSHTGEKPFKCPLCPHACTQASKLKRHMKTHQNKSPMSAISQGSSMSTGSENSIRSTSSTPDSSKISKLDEDAMDAENEESEEEEEEYDEEEDAAYVEELHAKLGKTHSTDLSLKKPMDFNVFTDINESSEEPTDLSASGNGKDHQRASVISEVMENTGLSNIQQYSEAFKQALAESTHHEGRRLSADEEDKKPITENGLKDNHRSHTPDDATHSSSHEKDFDYEHGHLPKRIKLEPHENQHLGPGVESIYPRIWFPPTTTTRDMFLSSNVDHEQPLPAHHESVHHNGNMNAIHDSCSALRMTVNSPKPGTSLSALVASNAATNATAIPPTNKRDRRSDTCEYCGKIFKNCSNLTVHRRSHTGEKPYKCGLCSYACAQSSKLTRHMKTHGRLGKDVYRCKFCEMPFSVPSTLEKHMRKCPENQLNRSALDTNDESNSTNASNTTV